ncbi:MAG: serine/threonine-protein phosphatase [Phycisphaerales bacterium]|nr:serine/threonine-protein phosphatase [Phycisphaerales bacterium]
MRAQRITIVDPTPSADRPRDWQRTIEAHWPTGRGSPPTVHHFSSVSELIDDPDSAAAVVMLILEDGGPDAGTYQILDLMDLRHKAVLVVATHPERDADRLSNVNWVPINVDPDSLVARLETLLDRQRHIDRLVAELTLARRFEGGITSEMARMHEELELAASVQREFLPRSLPEVDGLEFGVLFRPCSYVSGDIYGAAQLDDEHIGFFVADATGHGVPAALMTVIISRSLQLTLSGDDGTRLFRPGEALARLNDDLATQHTSSGRFATAVCGIINTTTREVSMASAGHPPPLLIDDAGLCEVKTGGSLLGVFPAETYADTTFTLEPGQRLLLFSDGFELAFPPKDSDPKSRRIPTQNYLQHFSQLCCGSLSEAMRTLDQQIDAQAGSLHQLDDLTALAIGAKPSHVTAPGRTMAVAADAPL